MLSILPEALSAWWLFIYQPKFFSIIYYGLAVGSGDVHL